MIISVATHLFRDEPTPAMAEHVHRLGFRRVALDSGHPDGLCDYRQAGERGADQTRRLLADYGLTPESYGIGTVEPDGAGDLERAFQFARGLGVGLLTGVTHQALLEAIDGLCGQYDLRYAVENRAGHVFERAEDFVQALLQRSERIGVDFASGNFRAADLDVVEQARKLRGRIYHVHLTDSEPGKLLGQGDVGILNLLDELRAQGYEGALAIEQGGDAGLSAERRDTILRDSLALVRSIIKQA